MPALIGWWPLADRLLEESRQSAMNQLEVRTSMGAQNLQHVIELLEAKTQTLSNDSDIIHGGLTHLLLTRVDRRLDEFLTANPLPSAVYLYDQTGKLRTAAPVGMDFQRHLPFSDQVDKFFSGEEGFDLDKPKVAFIENKEFLNEHFDFLSTLNYKERSVPQSDTSLIIFSPFKDFKDNYNGLLVVVVPLERLVSGIKKEVSSSRFFLLRLDTKVEGDGPGEVILRDPKFQENMLDDSQMISANHEIQTFTMRASESLRLQIFEPLSTHLAPVYKEIRSVLFVLSITILGLTIFGIVVGRLLAKPIKRLSDHIKSYAEGNYDTPRPKVYFYEFQRFVDLIQDMGQKILKHIELAKRQSERENELKKARLESELSALRFQMKPHFLFNALNGIVAVCMDEPALAKDMLLELSHLYHSILEASRSNTIALKNEVKIIVSYINLQKMRFGERLDFKMDIPSEYLNIYVPGMLLQTIVENAIKHGVEKSVRGGVVSLGLQKIKDKHYRFTITNTGEKLAFPLNLKGIGLINTKKRLEVLYGDEYEFSVASGENNETVVIIALTGESL